MEIALIVLACILIAGWLIGAMILTVVFVFAAALIGDRKELRRNLRVAALWPIAFLVLKDGDIP